jgi:hypothetical protein
VPAVHVNKRDRRGWVVLRDSQARLPFR